MKENVQLLIALFLFFSSCNLAPGSYPYAELYEFEVNETRLIEAVSEFKNSNPSFIVPKHIGLNDGRSSDKSDRWYHVWFYYGEENQIVYGWIRGNKLALVSVNQGTALGNWKRINKDFGRSENREEKRKFEERILNKMKAKL